MFFARSTHPIGDEGSSVSDTIVNFVCIACLGRFQQQFSSIDNAILHIRVTVVVVVVGIVTSGSGVCLAAELRGLYLGRRIVYCVNFKVLKAHICSSEGSEMIQL